MAPRAALPINHNVKLTAVICSDARRGGAREPLLGHHMPFRPNGFARDPAPRPLDDSCASGEQSCARARQGVVTKCIRTLPAARRAVVTRKEPQPATERNLHDIPGRAMCEDRLVDINYSMVPWHRHCLLRRRWLDSALLPVKCRKQPAKSACVKLC